MISNLNLFTNVEAASMGYSVKANLPENQIDKNKTYFDLKMDPNQKEEISLTVKNSSEEEIILNIVPNNSKTNQNGVIDYSDENLEKDKSLKYSLTDIISGKQKIKLNPGETKDVTFSIKMPNEELQGIILGGFYIYREDNETKNTNENLQIKNSYSYVIGIQLSQNTIKVDPKLSLNKIKPALQNYHTVVTANIQNSKPTIINNLIIDAKVTKEGESKVIHETNKQGMSMAPNSNFDFPISWDNEPLEAGDYTLHLKINTGEKEWSFDKNFSIGKEDTKKLNDEAVNIDKKEINWNIVALTISILLIICGITIVGLTIRHKKKIDREKKIKAARIKKRRKAKNSERNKKKIT